MSPARIPQKVLALTTSDWDLQNSLKELHHISTVKPDLTTTCEQRPPVNNGQFESSTASQNLSFIRHLCLTAAFFRSQGWSLYTGLTVHTPKPLILGCEL
jgi:hypothetical protein